ncbi:hypothetical protein D5041_04465 [Verminephrobacter aporrectodeae subsp. tuberculatae]|nr:hypothetical protein [Verminephrobacter aporrectodeae subsp. tuberculatae]MCW5288339.1 hypothetical protein [Verminephrobacter aporrectodeae subsp. tuberculatae]
MPALRTGEPLHLAVDSTGPKLCVCGEALSDWLEQIAPGTPVDIVGSDGAYDTKACPAWIAAREGAMPWPLLGSACIGEGADHVKPPGGRMKVVAVSCSERLLLAFHFLVEGRKNGRSGSVGIGCSVGRASRHPGSPDHPAPEAAHALAAGHAGRNLTQCGHGQDRRERQTRMETSQRLPRALAGGEPDRQSREEHGVLPPLRSDPAMTCAALHTGQRHAAPVCCAGILA